MGSGEDPTGVFPTQSEPSLWSGCVEPSMGWHPCGWLGVERPRGRPVSRGQGRESHAPGPGALVSSDHCDKGP